VLVERRHVGVDLGDDGRVRLLRGHVEERLRVVESGIEPVKALYDLREPRALAAERLSPLGLAPDVGQLELPIDLLEPLAARTDVKDTPSGHRDALACP